MLKCHPSNFGHMDQDCLQIDKQRCATLACFKNEIGIVAYYFIASEIGTIIR